MGGMFAFVASQYRLEVGNKEFFIDLLLYHRQLNCLIAIALKTGEFLTEYVEEMQCYLTALDDFSRLPDENLSIGILLCKSKNKTIVEYALKEPNKPTGIETYKIVSTLPQEFKNQLPEPEQIARLLEGIE
jgi:hypothetical protein